jgi:tRNA (guanine37-N1)-methyltransferase
MRIDIATIFPDYLTPLDLSLVGKARQSGLITVTVHDLRAHAHDRHRTVDDTPYGGGPGMVMRPEPWGECLDVILGEGEPTVTPTLLVPSPSGSPMTQADADRWALMPWIIIACGRYEGIDARVAEHMASRIAVEHVSLGDYVLAGGEVAALVIVEAVTRLLPGVVGNPDSIRDDSFAAGDMADVAEGPAYTRPPVWRGLSVPDILLSGHHGAIAQWRREQARLRTQARTRRRSAGEES